MAANPFTDWTKNFGSFGDFKTPVDFNDMIKIMRKNAEMGSAVMQIFTESAQEIAKRSAEVARTNAEQALKASKELMNHSTPESAASKQADLFKHSLDHNVNAMREIAEMSTKSAQEAFDVINKRVAEQMKELSEAAGSATTHSSKKKAA